jgi:hypothetical protein
MAFKCHLCRYEIEENPEVCSSMERMAHMFMSDACGAPEPEMEPEEEQQALEEGPSSAGPFLNASMDPKVEPK